MKKIPKLILASLSLIIIFSACNKVDNLKKVEELPVYVQGVSPVLSSSLNTVSPTIADTSSEVISFMWTDPKYGTDLANTKYILMIDSTNKNFGVTNNTKTVTGVLKTGMTGRELNAHLLNLGFKIGVTQSIDLVLISSYTNNNERYLSNVITVQVKPFADPSILVSQNASVVCTLPTAALPSNVFWWTPTFSGFTGIINYTLQYDSAGKNFVAPFEISVGASILSKGLTQGEMNETALNSGIPGGNTGKVEYRIKGVTSNGTTLYSNVVNVTIQSYVPILRVYLPGGYQASTGNGNNWDPGTAPELIRDLRPAVFNKLYYIYIYLPAGAEFKITIGRSWDVNYGGSGGVLSGGGANLSVPTAGYYRVSVNISTLQYNIMTGRMGFVGGATGANWDPPSVFPTYALGNSGTNLFVGLTNFTLGEWKLIDNNQWNNGSNAVDETRSYGSTGGNGGTLETNGANFPSYATAGRYRVIWDGRDRDNVKYFTSPGTEMRVVGNGMTGVPDWNPGASPQMTYTGNGTWTITLPLDANEEIKFLAGNDWGAFDYEDNSGQSQATGTPRPIQWDGGPNFKTPATAGTYTITLNENLQTVTIN
ncbi:MAG: SusE domain-containing protein [Ferruginibacter sp.]